MAQPHQNLTKAVKSNNHHFRAKPNCRILQISLRAAGLGEDFDLLVFGKHNYPLQKLLVFDHFLHFIAKTFNF